MFIICGMLTGNGMAQVKYKTEYFTSEDGLSHRMVSTMFKDDDGFMWFGTWNGINRFDGKTFKSFKTSALGSQRIHNDRVRQVVDDHKGFYGSLLMINTCTVLISIRKPLCRLVKRLTWPWQRRFRCMASLLLQMIGYG
ncbi:two-component regulator propeller domain-containing protein [Niabella hibiscisoli]|uniref:two-component regulator propeller domain-containing protein n=1 Tax=Niabella hibiscisoli TaxID=1825928 RepID=UPI001F0D6EA1|nr:two-component regulator propeller domain-containing protein [Niabella hibiscisoli]MCH5720294.1 hypothetical protein [Niabella hibiscisoli]